MSTREDIESFLIRMSVHADEVADGMWVIRDGDSATDVVMHYSPPVLVLRLKVMALPKNADDARLGPFYRKLLELNASDIVHGSYAIEEGDVILTDTLALEDLDFSELRSSYESLVLAASSHTAGLAGLAPAGIEG